MHWRKAAAAHRQPIRLFVPVNTGVCLDIHDIEGPPTSSAPGQFGAQFCPQVMVGDNLSADIAGGANYGISTCWYNPGERRVDSAHRIDHEIADLQELVSLVAG